MTFFRILLFAIMVVSGVNATAQNITWQNPEHQKMYEQARTLLTNGNANAALPLYQQLLTLEPGQMIVWRDLGNTYYLTGNYIKADETLKHIIDNKTADEQTYMIAASSQKAQKKIGSAKKLLGKGITYNPASGILYHQYGVLYDEQNNMPSALGKWRDGIFNAPSFRTNYYEAATTYYKTTKPIWAIIYGEVFVNKEQLTPRSYETRKMLIAAYRKFFSLVTAEAQEFSRAKYSNPQSFEDAVVATLAKLSSVVSNGYSTENLIMLRTRFIIDWQKNYASRYPFSLFEYHDEMLREGVFDAYNQWLFGRVENAVQYQHWIEFHKEATPTMQAWIDKHPLQFTTDDAAYNTGKISSLFP